MSKSIYLSFCWRKICAAWLAVLLSHSVSARTLCRGLAYFRQPILRKSQCRTMQPMKHLQFRGPEQAEMDGGKNRNRKKRVLCLFMFHNRVSGLKFLYLSSMLTLCVLLLRHKVEIPINILSNCCGRQLPETLILAHWLISEKAKRIYHALKCITNWFTWEVSAWFALPALLFTHTKRWVLHAIYISDTERIGWVLAENYDFHQANAQTIPAKNV